MENRKLTAKIGNEEITPQGNWTTAKDFFPEIHVDQLTGIVTVDIFSTSGHQKKATIETLDYDVEVSPDGQAMFLRGTVSCRNWKNYKCSGEQKFCFAIFVGDSGHIYTHRAPATKGWMEAKPETITRRLRRLGIGRSEGIIQQGDFLLKPANSAALPEAEFKHEYMGSGHHKFDVPVLRAWSDAGTQIRITEPVTLRHTAIDGIQHPDVVVPPGVYIVGTTASSLRHGNARD